MKFETPTGSIQVEIQTAIIAGWTGRDRAAVDHHIAELAEIGVAAPSEVPLFYRVSANLLTQSGEIEVLGNESSGEVEPLVIRANGALWLGLASDHTDRGLEVVSVAASKQICAKPISGALWPLSDVEGHLDQLALSCDIEEEGAPVRYQQGTFAAILPLATLIARAELPEGGALLCGTLGAIGGVRPSTHYRMTLHDPVRARSIELSYDAVPLPVVA